MKTQRFAAGAALLLGVLALAAAAPAWAVSQDEAESIAWDFTNLKWVSPVTYDPPQNSGLVFYKGKTYTGEAYYFGGNDSTASFMSKMSSGYVPRKNAGIDCSAFVSRCWKTTRHVTWTIPEIATKIAWGSLVKGDALNIPHSHMMMYHYKTSAGAYVVWEASGGANQVVHRAQPASYAWTYTPMRFHGLTMSGGSPAPAPAPTPAPPPSTGSTSTNKVVLVTVDALNVRTGPSTAHGKIGSIHKGQRFVAHAKDGAWYKIWFAGGSGWCHGSYVSEVTGVPVAKVKATSLNVRTGPSTGYSIFGSVEKDQKYVPSHASGGWQHIDYDSRSGWVSGDYVTMGSP